MTERNGVIPNQVYAAELKKILENAENYLRFLNKRDESGYTVSERILMLFSFQIPYYIGPVSSNSALKGGNGWVIRKEDGAVLPWNISQKIDIEKTSEQFIMRMVKECSYIRGEKALPKASLEYEAYCVLNEINNLKIDGEPISIELKQGIYTELFQLSKNGKVTRKQIEKFLISRGVLNDGIQLSGIDDKVNNALTSYAKLKRIIGDKIDRDAYKGIAEGVIRLGTIFGDSKVRFLEELKEQFGSLLSEDEIVKISNLKFKDWGRLSKEFLELKGCYKGTGEEISIIRALWEFNYNLIELINSDEFTFKDVLEDVRTKTVADYTRLSYEDLNEFYFSAPVKRMVWQTISLVEEIVQIMGCEPERIFVEMTRSDEERGDKGRKDSRGKQLLELYKNIKDDLRDDWSELISSADANGKLRSKKMFLYISQMGREMYTGDPIDLDKLFDDNIYDIDHIYPRSIVKDDSIHNNLVLVYKTDNSSKKDIYPLADKIVGNNEVRALWKRLRDAGLMNGEKYARLTSRKAFTDEQRAGFIARQLVETSQATKGVSEILKGMCNSTIVYSKAGNISDFRQKFSLMKARSANEFHHAHDAYLNIVVGNAYYVKFTQNPLNYIRNEYKKDPEKNRYHLGKMFERNITREGEYAWIVNDGEKKDTLETVIKTISKPSPLMTKLCTENHGKLYDVNIGHHKAAKAENYVAVKASDSKMTDVSKYGGYGSLKNAYFIFIEYTKGKKVKRGFDAIPVIYKDRFKNNEDLKKYCEDELHYDNVRIICSRIKKYSLIKMDGYYLYITGLDNRRNVEFHNAVNLCVPKELNNYVHDIEITQKWLKDTITPNKNLELYDYILEKFDSGIYAKHPKNIGQILKNGRNMFENLKIEEQVQVLNKLLIVMGVGAANIGLKEIGGPSSDVGRIRISADMTNRKELILINQSITGLVEKKVDLLSL